MIELYYSIGLLSAAVIFQGIVHYYLTRVVSSRKQQHPENVTLLSLDRRLSSSNSTLAEMDAAETLDGDEPPVFFELLSQTGSEMLMVCAIVCCDAQEFGILFCFRAGRKNFEFGFVSLIFSFLRFSIVRVPARLKPLFGNAWTVIRLPIFL